uniref:CpxA n=1 Tax=Vibrio anguillarum TaxID=55601 RepID=B5LBG2_VIBAN|nr:CpxA [Vibrio anguillarum]
MRLPKINSLYGRIFAIFWFTMLLVLIAVLALPHLDPRKTRDIPSDEYQRLTHLKQKIESMFKDEHELTRILFRLESSSNKRGEGHMREKNGTPQFFITTPDGTILTTKTQADFKFKALQNFVTSIESIDKPQQKLDLAIGLLCIKHEMDIARLCYWQFNILIAISAFRRLVKMSQCRPVLAFCIKINIVGCHLINRLEPNFDSAHSLWYINRCIASLMNTQRHWLTIFENNRC